MIRSRTRRERLCNRHSKGIPFATHLCRSRTMPKNESENNMLVGLQFRDHVNAKTLFKNIQNQAHSHLNITRACIVWIRVLWQAMHASHASVHNIWCILPARFSHSGVDAVGVISTQFNKTQDDRQGSQRTTGSLVHNGITRATFPWSTPISLRQM